ncbi:MAG: winged helix-turn-helix domain-containing protein [Gammaproteobacteria bacterium]|nr:winged helix-turn-helix domain-containing protein [Gammaproteobacteria bacterium]
MNEHRTTGVREYRFGDCSMDMQARELRRGDTVVATEPKAFDLLAYLIANRDRAVDKTELQDEVWTGTIVTESALTRCVMKARRAIGDSQDAIKTVRGHGYRFAGDVDEIRDRPASHPALQLPDKPSVAVLPFINLGDDSSQDYFSDGITEDIITELSRFRSIFVIARHSSFSFRGQSMRTREIARELGVQYVVDGSVQRFANRVRINVRLVEAASEAQLWSERFDRELEDILLVQDEVAATVAATIGGRVEARRSRRRFDSIGLESYDYVLRAQALYYQVDKAANDEAMALLEKAVEIDPDNARAMILLAACHSMASWSFWAQDDEGSRRMALELGQQSLALDNTDSLAHALFAEILFDCEQAELAEYHFLRALSLNPNDIAARALYAAKLSAMGRREDALEQIQIAERLDPFGLHWIPWIKSTVMFAARHYEEAAVAFETMAVPPNEARYIAAAAYAQLGRLDEAANELRLFQENARQDMPNYPGDSARDMRRMLERMVDFDDAADLDHLMESLEIAGLR